MVSREILKVFTVMYLLSVATSLIIVLRDDTEYKYHGKRFTQSPSLSRDQNMGPSGPRLCQIFRRSFSQLQSILVRSGQNQHIIDAIINYQN